VERASKFDRLKKVEEKNMGLGKQVNCVDVITPPSLSPSLFLLLKPETHVPVLGYQAL